jgi:hypothetical protein
MGSVNQIFKMHIGFYSRCLCRVNLRKEMNKIINKAFAFIGVKRVEQSFEQVTINGKTYYAQKPQDVEHKGDYKIVVLQRGWVMVGKLEKQGSECKLHSASVIRNWGTTKGLGEIATGGPTSSTKLDKCGGVVEFDYLTVVATIAVNEDKWKNAL